MLPSEITATTPATTTATQETSQLGQDDFLRMLIAQLENQDPLDPEDATEFSAQLAQFSSLEQLIGMRTAVEDLASAQNASQALAAAGLIGRQVLAETNQFEVPLEGEHPTLYLEVPEGAQVYGVDVVDGNGRIVTQTNWRGILDPGLQEISWEEFSSAVPPGNYSVRVQQVINEAGPATSLFETRVTGASVSGDSPVLLLGEAVVPLSGIREVRE